MSGYNEILDKEYSQNNENLQQKLNEANCLIEELRKENERLNEMNNALMKRIDNAVCALRSVHFDLKIK